MSRSASISGGLAVGIMLTGCATFTPPEIDYDADVPPLLDPPVLENVEETPKPLHTPPAWRPARGGPAGMAESTEPEARIAMANAAARIEPRRAGYYNAIQMFPFSPGALYQVYATPGQITSIALEPGERLTGSGPIAAGDTARWIIGDTVSGNGRSERVHILVKPTRPNIATNLVLNTDRRTYLIELRSREEAYMPAVAWAYPDSQRAARRTAPPTPAIPSPAQRNHRYGLSGDTPPWRPVSVFDDRRRVYVVFPRGIVQGEMPPLFVLGPDGAPELVNTRIHQNVLIVDRLFAAAELRLGDDDQQIVRIVRTDARPES